MDPIIVPAPPRSSYNPNRRVSDLLLSQLKHFQHIELKRKDLGIAPEIARDIYTEAGAARYISALTTALRGNLSSPSVGLAAVPAPRAAKEPPTTIPGVALAAGAATVSAAPKKKASRKGALKTRPARKVPSSK